MTIKKSQYSEIVKYYDTGKTLGEVGDKWGVSKERIRQILLKVRPSRALKPYYNRSVVSSLEKVRKAIPRIRKYSKLKTRYQVAEMLGVNISTMARALVGTGIRFVAKKQEHPHAVRPEVAKEVVKQYIQGWPYKALVKKFNISGPTISKIIKTSGVKMRGSGNWGRNEN